MKNTRSGISRKRFIGTGAAGVAGAAMVGSGVAHAAQGPGPTLDAIANPETGRGYIKVAVAGSTGEGFFENNLVCVEYDPDPPNPCTKFILRPYGIEADFARAVAAAIFGETDPDVLDDNYIKYVGSTSTTRWYHLFGLSGYEMVDVVFRSITNTYERDGYQTTDSEDKILNAGCTFGPTYYYDGADVLVYGTIGPDPENPWTARNIAVALGTTTYDVVSMVADDYNFTIIGTYDSDQAKQAFIDNRPGEYEYGIVKIDADTIDDVTKPSEPRTIPAGSWISVSLAEAIGATWTEEMAVDGWSSDTSGLIGTQIALDNMYDPADPPETSKFFASLKMPLLSKEPLAPGVREDDDNWADIIRWVMYVLFQAEEDGITKDNIGSNPEWGDGIPGAEELIPDNTDWPRDVIAAVGNYADIWERNLAKYDPAFEPRGINSLWTDDGLLYAPAFR